MVNKKNIKEGNVIEKAVSEERSKEPKKKDERWIKAFILIMTLVMILAAALTERTYNGYDPNPNYVALTGFIAIVTILLTAAWYRTKYNDFAYQPEQLRERFNKLKESKEN